MAKLMLSLIWNWCHGDVRILTSSSFCTCTVESWPNTAQMTSAMSGGLQVAMHCNLNFQLIIIYKVNHSEALILNIKQANIKYWYFQLRHTVYVWYKTIWHYFCHGRYHMTVKNLLALSTAAMQSSKGILWVLHHNKWFAIGCISMLLEKCQASDFYTWQVWLSCNRVWHRNNSGKD